MTLDDIKEMKRIFDQKNVPEYDRKVYMTVEGFIELSKYIPVEAGMTLYNQMAFEAMGNLCTFEEIAEGYFNRMHSIYGIRISSDDEQTIQ